MRLIYLFLPVMLICDSNAQWVDQAVQQELSGVSAPSGIDDYRPAFHFAPVNQDTTSICWSFATISFIETEMHRLGLNPVKLAVVYPVYYTFIEKAKHFVRTRGTSRFEPGDLFSTVFEIINKYGIVPESVYPGRTGTGSTYNHDSLYAELKTYLRSITENAAWNEELAVEAVGQILNKHLGLPPAMFAFEGRSYTPLSFLEDRVKLPWHDYLAVTSFTYAPFDSFCSLEVPDNWRRNNKYFNVSLTLFYNSLATALKNGYSAAIDGDIGEPGRYGKRDVAFIPEFDIPEQNISQAAREYRFENGLTTDDHLMHIVGYARGAGPEWFLVKDSWRDAWEGEQKGYFFYRSDFVKLKVLAYLVHSEAVPEIMSRIPAGVSVSVMDPFE